MTTAKQIIIDGVNVSGCEFFGETMKTHNCTLHYECLQSCKDTDCYYKQLKRKEQECERLKKANDEKNELLAKLRCPTIATAKRKVFCLQEQLDQLKAENETLKQYKASKQASYESMQRERNNAVNENRELKAENERLKNAVMLKCPQCGEVYLDPIGAKLYETLIEIKEIAEKMNKECFYNDFDCKDCDMKNGCTYFNKKQILQKISEVEDVSSSS